MRSGTPSLDTYRVACLNYLHGRTDGLVLGLGLGKFGGETRFHCLPEGVTLDARGCGQLINIRAHDTPQPHGANRIGDVRPGEQMSRGKISNCDACSQNSHLPQCMSHKIAYMIGRTRQKYQKGGRQRRA
jgi:hypothetical protein